MLGAGKTALVDDIWHFIRFPCKVSQQAQGSWGWLSAPPCHADSWCAKEAPWVAAQRWKGSGGRGNLGCVFHHPSNGSWHSGGETTEEASPWIHSLANRRPFYSSPARDGPLFGCSFSPIPSPPVMKTPKFVPEAVYLTVWKRTTVCCGKSSRLGCGYWPCLRLRALPMEEPTSSP